MTENNGALGSDLAKIDAYENTAADYVEIPDMSAADLSHVTWRVGSEPVSEGEGPGGYGRGAHQASRPTAGERRKEHINLRVDKDVLAAFRATGPGWQGRMNTALRKAAGLASAP